MDNTIGLVIWIPKEIYDDIKKRYPNDLWRLDYLMMADAILKGHNIDEQRIIKDICYGGSTDDLCDHNCTECELLEITPKALFESIRRKRNEDSD